MIKLIAQENCPGRTYGAEFEMPEGSELTELLLAGFVRVDDRMPVGVPLEKRIEAAIAEDEEMRRAERNLEGE